MDPRLGDLGCKDAVTLQYMEISLLSNPSASCLESPNRSPIRPLLSFSAWTLVRAY